MRTIKCNSNCWGSKSCKDKRDCACRCEKIRPYSESLADECIQSCQSDPSFDNVPASGLAYMCRLPSMILSQIYNVPEAALAFCGYVIEPEVIDPSDVVDPSEVNVDNSSSNSSGENSNDNDNDTALKLLAVFLFVLILLGGGMLAWRMSKSDS